MMYDGRYDLEIFTINYAHRCLNRCYIMAVKFLIENLSMFSRKHPDICLQWENERSGRMRMATYDLILVILSKNFHAHDLNAN